ncbi:hypothetical protein FQN57_004182 [Myotisia sp. PD_48]|nr:hypothetical protein FQN57_004182 [Myotisia sp. PD_48]
MTIDQAPSWGAPSDVAQEPLQSKEHREVLDIIDKLRSQGVSRYVDLPQIVVCGDQSSGKSSVLEAISGLSFPTRDNLCTRFATELILRRSPVSALDISIIPGPDCPSDEQEALRAFTPSIPVSIENPCLDKVVEEAKEAMGLSVPNSKKVFSTDVLRVELSGPEQPHLTMVDLPGLFEAGNREQSEEDAHMVKELVLSYMKNARSVILTVVSAKSDFALQSVTKYARKIDRTGMRTMGLITKPDTLDQGSETERSYLELAQNKDVKFLLGWHVLRNRDFSTRHASTAERDQQEKDFFARGIWASLDPAHAGISALKPRLSHILRDQILDQLPKVLDEVKASTSNCKGRLERMGSSRATLQEQRQYLLHISHSFSTHIKAAVGGIYDDPFFGNASTELGYKKRLRAVVQNRLLSFASEMRKRGHHLQIVEDEHESVEERALRNDMNSPGNPQDDGPRKISRLQYSKEVEKLMIRTRGTELPGTFNPLIVRELFKEQRKPWEGLVNRLALDIFNAAHFTVNSVTGYVADKSTAGGILREIIIPKLYKLRDTLNLKISEILDPHKFGHPITYNHYVIENVQKAQAQRRKCQLEKDLKRVLDYTDAQHPVNVNFEELLSTLNESTIVDMDRYATYSAIDTMEAYYKVALKTVVDNIAVLAIESCLIKRLPELFVPENVLTLTDDVIEKIAMENEEAALERKSLTEKLQILEAGLWELSRLGNHRKYTGELRSEIILEDYDFVPDESSSSSSVSVEEQGGWEEPEPVVQTLEEPIDPPPPEIEYDDLPAPSEPPELAEPADLHVKKPTSKKKLPDPGGRNARWRLVPLLPCILGTRDTNAGRALLQDLQPGALAASINRATAFGAGPVGLFLSLCLSRWGYNIKHIDNRATPTETCRADGIQPRSLDILRNLGLKRKLMAYDPARIYNSSFWGASPLTKGIHRIGDWPTCPSRIDARYPFTTLLHQGKIERIFIEELAGYGISVDRPWTIVDFVNDACDPDYPIFVTMKDLDTDIEHTARTRYLFGGDGTQSFVREQLGIEIQYREPIVPIWGVLDGIVTTDFPDVRTKCIIQSHHGAILMVPRDGNIVRFYVQLASATDLDQDPRNTVTVEQVQEITKKILLPYKIIWNRVEWLSIHPIGQGFAESYSLDQRIFIGGDACHSHSPIAGQGINAAFHDALNLAWKLHLVIAGFADCSTLATYESERKLSAENLVDFETKYSRLFSQLQPSNSSNGELVDAFKSACELTSGYGIIYPPNIFNWDQSHRAKSALIQKGENLLLSSGRPFPPCTVVRVSDANVVHLEQAIPMNGSFRIYVFAGQFDHSHMVIDDFCYHFGKASSIYSLYSYSSEAQISNAEVVRHNPHSRFFTLALIYATPRHSIDMSKIPRLLYEYPHHIYADDVPDIKTLKSHASAHEKLGFDPSGTGGVIVVRPDGHIACVVELVEGRGTAEAINEYFSAFVLKETNEIPGSRGEANFVWKCRLCGRTHSASITAGPTAYDESKDKGQKIIEFDCRGLEFTDFRPDGTWEAKGANSTTVFNEITFEEGEWFDFDEKTGEEARSFVPPISSQPIEKMNFVPLNPRPMLQSLVNEDIVVRLKWGQTEYRGQLISVDSYMNIQLSNTEEYIEGKNTGTLGSVLIRCNNVLWIGRSKGAESKDVQMADS